MSSEARQEVTYTFPPNRIRKTSLILFDLAFSALIVAPLTVSAWCSTWDLMDSHARLFPTLPSFCFSTGMMVGFTVARLVFQEMEIALKSLFGRVYVYCYFVVCIMQWRAAWLLMDEGLAWGAERWAGLKFVTGVVTVILVGLLLVFRCLRSGLATPYLLGVDNVGTMFDFPTRWKVNVSENEVHT